MAAEVVASKALQRPMTLEAAPKAIARCSQRKRNLHNLVAKSFDLTPPRFDLQNYDEFLDTEPVLSGFFPFNTDSATPTNL